MLYAEKEQYMKEKEALDYHKKGFNCAQSVFVVFAKEHGIPEIQALKVATGFGSGMGRLQATCGAVTGAYMAIGSKYGKTIGDEGFDKRDKTYELVRAFDKEFREEFKTTSCRELLGCDLMTDEGRKFLSENKLGEKVCERCIQEAVKIVEKIL
jgi:C_GCAxxG_C_C family probable redox protein